MKILKWLKNKHSNEIPLATGTYIADLMESMNVATFPAANANP